MDIHFKHDINGYQNARKLKMILEYFHQADVADTGTRLFIESIEEQLDGFLSSPEFARLKLPRELDENPAMQADGVVTGLLAGFTRLFAGPTRRELLLSKQRQELIERAERAEAMAFAALAESTEAGRERDAALEQLRVVQSAGKDGS